jgi:hypothetical protein
MNIIVEKVLEIILLYRLKKVEVKQVACRLAQATKTCGPNYLQVVVGES